MEELLLSESDDSDESEYDVYGADPVFASRQELDAFMASCNIQKGAATQSGDDRVSYIEQKKIKKSCTCGKCDNIWSGDFEHICCQQIERCVAIDNTNLIY